MTIGEAILRCDNLKPNQYTEADKIKWLSDLDGIVKREILDTHQKDSEIAFDGYTEQTPETTELLIQEPYTDTYLKYLFAQIDFHNGEFARYNNSMVMFNVAYSAFADDYNRTTLPVQENSITL